METTQEASFVIYGRLKRRRLEHLTSEWEFLTQWGGDSSSGRRVVSIRNVVVVVVVVASIEKLPDATNEYFCEKVPDRWNLLWWWWWTSDAMRVSSLVWRKPLGFNLLWESVAVWSKTQPSGGKLWNSLQSRAKLKHFIICRTEGSIRSM